MQTRIHDATALFLKELIRQQKNESTARLVATSTFVADEIRRQQDYKELIRNSLRLIADLE